MFKWHVRNSKALLHMTRIYILLFLPAGSPFTEVPEKFEQRLKLEGVSLDATTFKASDRDELLQKIPAFCFNARYHLSKNYLILSLRKRTNLRSVFFTPQSRIVW